MNILDYLSWRNDVPFTVSKFNEVDSLILSELAYIDFEKIVESSSISLQDVNDEFFLHHNREEIEEETQYSLEEQSQEETTEQTNEEDKGE